MIFIVPNEDAQYERVAIYLFQVSDGHVGCPAMDKRVTYIEQAP